MYKNRLQILLRKKVEILRIRYEKCMNQRVFKEPLQKIQEKYIVIDMKIKSMQNSAEAMYKDKKGNAMKLIAKLDALSPLKTLMRGYSIVSLNGKSIKSAKDLNKDDEVELRLSDGSAKAKIL